MAVTVITRPPLGYQETWGKRTHNCTKYEVNTAWFYLYVLQPTYDVTHGAEKCFRSRQVPFYNGT